MEETWKVLWEVTESLCYTYKLGNCLQMGSTVWLKNENTNMGKFLVIYSSLYRFKISHW